MTDIEPIAVEVAYATPEKQMIIPVLVDPGTTAYDAVLKSKICKEFSEINLAEASFGIFGQALGSKGLAKAEEHILKEGDRVEIYRPLLSKV